MEVKSNKEELSLDLIDLVNLFEANEDIQVEHIENKNGQTLQNKFKISCPSLNIDK